ncbi:RIP metalloprotease RseP [Reichenbachiella sp. MALMAid0571]|uniref:RIP metalloprotease RseP n=1 Tax=Reichenbachiella sp. MALMAid0571 TaxID=3143939 RepID=UPI0032DEA9AF
MEGLVMTAQLILGLSILVGVHEWGHLIAAKAFGMRVEKFSIGFPPKIWGFQYGETEYSIGAIPLGGFVKISGMIDESLDTKNMKAEPDPWEFRAKPAWQRLIVMMGGIIVNVITGILIFIGLFYSQGESIVTKEELNKHGILAYELGQEIGFKTGDKVLEVNGKDFKEFTDLISPETIMAENASYLVQRGNEKITINIPITFLDKYSDKENKGRFISFLLPFEVGQVMVGTGADKGGLKEGDKFVSINGQPITYFHELKEVLDKSSDTEITAVVKRKSGKEESLNIQVDEDGTLGFYPVSLLNYSHYDYNLAEATVKGTEEAFGKVWVNILGFGKIFRGEVSLSKSLSGPIRIAQIYGGTWSWVKFWNITGLLSMILAFMNFLPIPALDGGHVVFLTYEMVSGRKPSDQFLENAQKVGMILLLGIMGFAIFNDIFQSIF